MLYEAWDFILEYFLEVLPYVGIIIISVAAIISIAKDYWAKNPKKMRWPVLIATIIGIIISLISTYSASKDAKIKSDEFKEHIAELKGTRSTLLETHTVLLDKVLELSSEIRSDDMQLKLEQTKQELIKFQDALKSEPKAKIVFSLRANNEIRFDPENPRKEIFLPINDDSLHLSFLVLNATDVAAEQLSIWLQICTECDYIEEPFNFHKSEVAAPKTLVQNKLLALGKTVGEIIEFKIRVPQHLHKIPIAFRARCLKCEPTTTQKFYVNITNR